MSSETPIQLTIKDAIATITINRPARRNALNLPAWGALSDVTRELDANDAVRCVIVRGSGERAFGAGGDIIEFQSERATAQQAIAYGDVVAQALEDLFRLKHPTIAMIYGACTGGALEVACACDLRISAQSGRFGVPINRLGHAFAYPEAAMVMRVVPRHIVLEMVYEGRIMGADEAYARGLLNRVVADAELAENVAATARAIADGAPLAARMSKRITADLQASQPISRAALEAGYAPCDSADYREGLAAFADKRVPVFSGK